MIEKAAGWSSRAELAQTTLRDSFWNGQISMFNIQTPCPNGECNTIFHYWWMAHAVEALVDGLERTGDEHYRTLLSQLYDGLLKRNGGAWPNNLYDDMEWMAIGWLRAYQATGEERYAEAAKLLWEDTKTGWSEELGGGIAWQKTQLDYKNTPANAPAAILAARLYRQLGHDEDLNWAERIYKWLKANLVDPDTGFVWDGMNRLGDGSIDKDWKFTYCQGVYIGAGIELYRLTGETVYLDDAVRTAHASLQELLDAQTSLLPAEGNGDGGLFKGIYVRYLAELILELGKQSHPQENQLAAVLIHQAESLISASDNRPGLLFGTDWGTAAEEPVELSSQLSGVILLEMAAKLERGKGEGRQ